MGNPEVVEHFEHIVEVVSQLISNETGELIDLLENNESSVIVGSIEDLEVGVENLGSVKSAIFTEVNENSLKLVQNNGMQVNHVGVDEDHEERFNGGERVKLVERADLVLDVKVASVDLAVGGNEGGVGLKGGVENIGGLVVDVLDKLLRTVEDFHFRGVDRADEAQGVYGQAPVLLRLFDFDVVDEDVVQLVDRVELVEAVAYLVISENV